MEVHSRVNSVVAKKLWKILRVTLLMMRKGVISKRKLIMDINLMMKKGKLLRKALSNLMFHHHSRHVTRGSFGIQDYEFSCSNSPNPVFFHVPKRKHHYFPCIKSPAFLDEDHVQEQQAVVLLPKTPDYMFNFQFDASEFGPEEKTSPLPSPFSVRVSNYSSEDENSDGENGNGQVDDQAEEFIRRFYDQLRVQSRRQLLQYQEMQYQEMLARGTAG